MPEAHSTQKKLYIIVIVVVIAVVAIASVYLVTRQSTGNEPFRFEPGSGDRKVLSLRADRYHTGSGLGGFSGSTGLGLDNAYLDLYGTKTKDTPGAGGGLSLKNTLSEESFSTLPVKNIAVIEAKPIAIKIHDDQGTPTQMFAAAGTIKIKDREILLKGEVRILSEPYLLLTDQLTFLPETGRLQIGKYVMRTSDERMEGSHLTTDLFLKAQK